MNIHNLLSQNVPYLKLTTYPQNFVVPQSFVACFNHKCGNFQNVLIAQCSSDSLNLTAWFWPNWTVLHISTYPFSGCCSFRPSAVQGHNCQFTLYFKYFNFHVKSLLYKPRSPSPFLPLSL